MIYISDLDGTLLNSDGKLSQYTVQTIKQLKNEGVKFTIATARSIFSAADFIDVLDLNIPIILRNGAFVYNPVDKKVLMQKLLEKSHIQPVLDFLIKEGLNPIVHHIERSTLFVDYTKIENYGEQHYIESRLNAGDPRLRKVSDHKYSDASEFIAICVIDENEKQNSIFKIVEKLFSRKFIIHKYVDSYSNHTWIEINHPEATKKNAAEFVMNFINESEYTAFGDNINDIDMLEGAEMAYIPQDSYLDRIGYKCQTTLPIDRDGVALKLIEITK